MPSRVRKVRMPPQLRGTVVKSEEVLRYRERLLAVEYGAAGPPKGLDGEDFECTDVADVEHWVKVYTELVEFTRGLLDAPPGPSGAGDLGSSQGHCDLRALALQARVQELHLCYWVNRLDQLRNGSGPEGST